VRRRLLLALPVLAGCSVLPDRPFQESRRYPLAPARPAGLPRRPATGQALLLRTVRAGPGLELRGLRRLRPDGTVEVLPYDEWLAPPADLVEAALRDWLVRSQMFTAVTAPGSRLPASLILEAELTRLDTDGQSARAELAVLLLREATAGNAQVLAQNLFASSQPLGGASAEAQAMTAALSAVFTDVEAWLARRMPAIGRSARRA
jgi:ABC-type uncharacterized transport system auxiliary subunit